MCRYKYMQNMWHNTCNVDHNNCDKTKWHHNITDRSFCYVLADYLILKIVVLPVMVSAFLLFIRFIVFDNNNRNCYYNKNKADLQMTSNITFVVLFCLKKAKTVHFYIIICIALRQFSHFSGSKKTILPREFILGNVSETRYLIETAQHFIKG